MADAHAKPHHEYHLVDPSPWPAVGAVSAFVLAVGLITWMHEMFAAAPWIFAVGALTPSPATTSAAASRIAVRLSSLRGRAILLHDACRLDPMSLRDECLLNHRRSLPQRQVTGIAPAGSSGLVKGV